MWCAACVPLLRCGMRVMKRDVHSVLRTKGDSKGH